MKVFGNSSATIISMQSQNENFPTRIIMGVKNRGISEKKGTSMASPHDAGIVSLMLSVRPELIFEQIVSVIQSISCSFPTGSWCTTNVVMCGTGLVDVYGAVSGAVAFSIPTPNNTSTNMPTKTSTNTSTPINNFVDISPTSVDATTNSEIVLSGMSFENN